MENSIRNTFTLKGLLIIFALLPVRPLLAQFNNPIKKIEPATYIATYSLKYQQDSTNPSFIKQEDMLLFIGEHVSKFVSKNSYIFDTIVRRIKNWTEFQQMELKPGNAARTMSAFDYQIFKNYPKGKITTIDHTLILGNSFIYTENLDLINWKLNNDTATLKGYKVQKATCSFGGRSWIAWFTSEIPFRDGPYKFCGLPGLIIKISDTRNQYVFELETFNKVKNKTMIDYVEDEFIKSTKQGFFKAQDDFRNNIISTTKQAGLNSQQQQKAAKYMMVRNNLLELKRK